MKRFRSMVDSPFRRVLVLLTLAVLAPACGGGHGGGGLPPILTAPPPSAPTATTGEALAVVQWTPVPGATSYNVKRSLVAGGPYTTIALHVTTNSFTNTGLTNGTTYYYVVSSVNPFGEGSNSIQLTATPAMSATAPAAPGSLSALGGDAQVALQWLASAGAATYTVKRGTATGGPYVALAAGTNITNTTFTDSTALNGTPYFYVVFATNSIGPSPDSAEATATPTAPAAAPLAPTGLSAIPGDTTVSLSWSATANATTYTLKRGTATGGPYANIAVGLSGTTFSDTGRTNGTTYFYVVSAVNSVNPSPNSSEASATPVASVSVPSAPTGLAATGGNARVDLAWNSVATATTYTVKRGTAAGGPYAALAAGTGLTTTLFSDLTAVNGTNYFYVVVGVNSAPGSSANSNEATATPTAPPVAPSVPTGLAAASGNAQIVLTWTASTGVAPITYNVKRATVTGGPYTQIASGIVPVTYTDVTAVNGTTYFYVVSGQNPGGQSGNSTEASATPLAPPTNLTATGKTTDVDLAWTASTGAATYNVKYSLTPGGPYVQTANVGTTAYSHVAVTNGTPYYYVVTAVKGTSESAISAEAAATPIAIPTGVTATASLGQVALTWSAAAGAATYTVQRATVSGGPYANVQAGVAVTNYTDTGLANGTTYYYVVFGANATGVNSKSTISSEVVGTPLAAPTGVGCTAGTAQNVLAWNAVTGALSYNVKRSTVNGGPYAPLTTVGAPGFTDVTAANGTAYYYVVSAVNGASQSANSTQVAGTPMAAPTGVVATASLGQVALTWNAVTGAATYTVQRATVPGGPYANVQTGVAVANYTNVGLTNGTTYYYVVIAANATGQSVISSEVFGTPLAAPTGAGCTAGTSQNVLVWGAVTGAASYNVKRATVNGGPYAPLTNVGTLGYTDGTAVNGTTYYYVVTAVKGSSESGNSSQLTGTPIAAPTGLAATTSGGNSVSLTWAAAAGASGYTVMRSITSGSGYANVATNVVPAAYTDATATNGTSYFYVVVGTNVTGASNISNEAAATPLASPTGIIVTPGNAQVNFSWTAVPGATGYNVKRSTVSGSGYVTVGSPGTNNFLNNTGLVNGNTYFYVITATKTATLSESANSGEVSATPTGPPAAPTGLNATPGNTQVSLTWNSSPGATSYTVKYGTTTTGPYPTTIGGIFTTLATVTGLTNGTQYFFIVTATGPGGESLNSNEANATPSTAVPVAPTLLTATPGNGQVDLTWTNVGATNYNVKRSTTSGGPYGPVTTIPGTAFSDSTVTNGTNYFYIVTATNGGPESVNSNEMSAMPQAPPPVPTGLTATGSTGSVMLGWNASAGATTYNVRRSTVSGSGYVTIGTPGGPGFTDNTAANGTPYFYVVQAVNSIGGTSANSGEVSAVPLAVPTGLNFFATTSQVQLAWNPVTGASSYIVSRSTTSGFGYAQIATPGAANYNDNSAVNGTTYFYVVAAKFGGNSQSSNTSEVSGTPLAQPTGLTALPGDNQVALNWSAVTAATGYSVHRGTVNGGPYPTLVGSPVGTSITDNTAVNGTQYFYVVAATKGGFNVSSNSSQVASTPSAGPTVTNANPPDQLSPRVDPDTNLVLTFSMPMNQAEVQANFSLSPLAGGAVHSFVWTGGGTVLTVVFDANHDGVITNDDLLVDDTDYTWAISAGAHDQTNTFTMLPQSGHFKTPLDTVPPQISTIQATGAQDPRTTVLTGAVTSIVVTFNEAMDTSGTNGNASVSLDSNGDSRSCNVGDPIPAPPYVSAAWGPSNTLTITLNPALNANTGYRMQFNNLKDAAGNWINNNSEISMLTAGTGVAAPGVTATLPVDNATGVSRDQGVFIALSEPLSPNVVNVMTVTPGGLASVAIDYRLGKNDGPMGIQISPRSGWLASTAYQIKIPGGAGGVKNAGGTAMAADYILHFTTGANGVGNGTIQIDVAKSSVKDAMVDCDSYSGAQGEVRFSDNTGTAVYLDDTTLNGAAVTVKDSNGVQIKNFVVNQNNGGGEVGRSIQLGRRNGMWTSSLQQNMTYTLKFNSSIKLSTGTALTPVTYTFTTVPNSTTMSRPAPGGSDTNGKTAFTSPATLNRTVDLQVWLNSQFTLSVKNVAAHVGANTDYTVNNGWLPSWIVNPNKVKVQGCGTPANNGVFTVVSVTGTGPWTLTLANGAGVLEATPPGNAIATSPSTVSVADITATNTFTSPLFLDTSNGGSQFVYPDPSQPKPTNEVGITTSGVHTLQYSFDDGTAGGTHAFTVNDTTSFFTQAELSAIVPTTPPNGATSVGSTPLYQWTGAQPAGVTALFLTVNDNGGNTIYGWIIPAGTTQFQHPANCALPGAAGTAYSWTFGYFKSVDGTIRDRGGDGQRGPALGLTK